jgi:hypothetical protein
MKKIVLGIFMLFSVASFANTQNESEKTKNNTLQCSGTASDGTKIVIQCGDCTSSECYAKLEKAKKAISSAE